jgi:alanine racemase
MKFYRPTWAEIDLDAIRYNFRQLKRLLDKETKILVAVKANAYGHGMLEISDTLVACGVDYLGVGTTDEALLLRKNGFKIPVLILGSVLDNEIMPIIKNKITATIPDVRLAYAIDRNASRAGKRAKVHIKVDIGMGRIGVWHQEAIGFIKHISKLQNIEIEGVFSHFPSADDDELLTRRQIRDFSLLIEELQNAGIYIKYNHMANSIAVVDYKDSHMNLVRPGLMIYGLHPSAKALFYNVKLKPVLRLKSRVVFVKEVPPGRRISYGGSFITRRHTKIATIPIGYGDGLNRHLSNRGFVLVNGKKAPIVGRVCMDQIMVDVGSIDKVGIGTEVVLIGSQGKKRISVEEIAHLCDTIPYEVVCWFDNRVPRLYVGAKK